MTRYLCMSVMLLDPLFHGKGDGDEPEWPPSPMRLYQALLAGCRTGCRNREWSIAKTEAFRWLELRQPPEIVAPAVHRGKAHTLFVPNNDGDRAFDRQDRLTGKEVRPHHLLNGDTLHYVWPIEENEWASARPHVESLCRDARHLLALGWGIDQAIGNGRILSGKEVAALLGQRWRAWDVHRPNQSTYRIPVKDSLQDLGRVYQSFLGRVSGKQYRPSLKPKRFGSVAYIRSTALPARPCAAFELPEGVAFRQTDAVKVAAMLRSLTCKLAKEDTYKFPGGAERYVAGHLKEDESNSPRFSYLPLPTIGHPHADGLIRRLLIAEPFGGDSSCVGWALHRLRNAVLRDDEGNERGILLEPTRPGSKAMIQRYVGESRIWSSVTPVVLPGFDDFKGIKKATDTYPTKAERLLFKSLAHAGIPLESVASVTLRKAPFWPGSQHPKRYRRPDYLADQQARPGWHVQIAFHEPMAGPLAIGAGRHCGLGVFAITNE